MKKPNIREASEDYGMIRSLLLNTTNAQPLWLRWLLLLCMFTLSVCIWIGKLANALKNEENPQYAALCFTAMAK